MNIHEYIADRIPEPISVVVTQSTIIVSWMEGRNTRRRMRSYTVSSKLERICDELIQSVTQAMGY